MIGCLSPWRSVLARWTGLATLRQPFCVWERCFPVETGSYFWPDFPLVRQGGGQRMWVKVIRCSYYVSNVCNQWEDDLCLRWDIFYFYFLAVQGLIVKACLSRRLSF